MVHVIDNYLKHAKKSGRDYVLIIAEISWRVGSYDFAEDYYP